MRLLDKIMDHGSTPLDPLLSVFARNPVLTKISFLIIPAEDVFRIILHSHAGILLELLLGELAEIGCYAVVTHAVEDKSVNLRIFAGKLLQHLNLIFLNLRI